MFVPLVPSSALAAALAVLIALTYDVIGLGALAALVIVLLLFQILTGELLLSQDRAEQLEARTEQLGLAAGRRARRADPDARRCATG